MESVSRGLLALVCFETRWNELLASREALRNYEEKLSLGASWSPGRQPKAGDDCRIHQRPKDNEQQEHSRFREPKISSH